MRRAPLLLLGLLVPVACLSESDPTPLRPGPDASTPDGTTPTPPPIPPPPPPPPADAGPEAEAGPAPVVVTVLRGATPVAGATVVFHDAQGVVVDTRTTDATGRVTRLVDPDAMVTIATSGAGRNGAERRLLTFVGVRPGDALAAFAPAPLSSSHTVTMNLPANPLGGATDFYASVGTDRCTGIAQQSPASVLFLASYCARGATVPMLIVSRDQTSAVTGYSFLKGQPIPSADLTAPAFPGWTAPSTFAVSATNVPGALVELALSHVADAAPWRDSANPRVTGGNAAATFPKLGAYADGLQADLGSFQVTPPARGIIRTLSKRVATAAMSESLDASQLLPTITAVTTDQTTMARPLVSWTASGATTGTDGGFVGFRWFENTDAGFIDASWSFVVPPSATNVRAPALPAALAGWAPGVAVGEPGVAFVETDLVASYDELRQRYASFPAPDLENNETAPPTLPQVGTLRTTANAIYPQ